MRYLAFAFVAALSLAAGKPAEQAKTNAEVRDAASDVAQASKKIADSPAVEKAGDALKEAAHDTGTVLEGATRGAVSGAKEGMAKSRSERRAADETTTTTTTTTVETRKN